MSYIKTREGLPGIRGLMVFRPETARPLNALVDVLLHQAHSLSSGERELIATYVSYLNDCQYCQLTHGAVATAHLHDGSQLVEAVKRDFRSAPISEKLKTLLAIAEKVQKGGKHVTPEFIAAARSQGATDLEIHDTVLIAAAFCMFNRYVDGLGTDSSKDPAAYQVRAPDIARGGYQAITEKLFQDMSISSLTPSTPAAPRQEPIK